MHFTKTFAALLTSGLLSTALGSAIPPKHALEARAPAPVDIPNPFDGLFGQSDEEKEAEKLIKALCECKDGACVKKARRELVARGHKNVGIGKTEEGGDDDTFKTEHLMTCISVAIVGEKSDDSPDDAKTRFMQHIFGTKKSAEDMTKDIKGRLEKAKLKDIKWAMSVPDLDYKDEKKKPKSPTGMPEFGEAHVKLIKPAIEIVEKEIKDATDESPKEIVKRNMRHMPGQPETKPNAGTMEINKDGDILVEGKKVA